MNEQAIEKAKLQGSLLEFTRIFYKIRTGRLFEVSQPIGRESHHITICRELVKVFDGKTKRLIINVPPRYSKTELLIQFVAWGMANYPDSNFIYTSYAHSLAKKQTQTVRQIVQLPIYRKIFDVELRGDTTAKDNFETTQGGSVYAVGAGGTITGRGAGIKGAARFGGAFIMDDMHKPDEVTSDTMREAVIDWFFNTAQSRLNSPDTPMIFVGQCLHEDDLSARLEKTGEWEVVKLPALDPVGNALWPEMHTQKSLLKMKEESPYVFASQYQQNPQPAGGGIFKPEWFYLMNDEPEIICTFITVDTAETDKDYNDATVFSFFGVYKIKDNSVESDTYGLHWLDCAELRVEPKDLEPEFLDFYAGCMRHRVKPKIVAIEKKSTGVTLSSVLSNVRGLQIMNIERTKASGGKTTRFLEIQPYVAAKQVSLPTYGKHTEMCIEHCRKITANNSHRFDDICDTLADGVKLALIDQVIINKYQGNSNREMSKRIMSNFNAVQRIKENRTW
jgi:predicted phage terminase large subunit-like protein